MTKLKGEPKGKRVPDVWVSDCCHASYLWLPGLRPHCRKCQQFCRSVPNPAVR